MPFRQALAQQAVCVLVLSCHGLYGSGNLSAGAFSQHLVAGHSVPLVVSHRLAQRCRFDG